MGELDIPLIIVKKRESGIVMSTGSKKVIIIVGR
jgi:hypothetical protein